MHRIFTTFLLIGLASCSIDNSCFSLPGLVDQGYNFFNGNPNRSDCNTCIANYNCGWCKEGKGRLTGIMVNGQIVPDITFSSQGFCWTATIFGFSEHIYNSPTGNVSFIVSCEDLPHWGQCSMTGGHLLALSAFLCCTFFCGIPCCCGGIFFLMYRNRIVRKQHRIHTGSHRNYHQIQINESHSEYTPLHTAESLHYGKNLSSPAPPLYNPYTTPATAPPENF